MVLISNMTILLLSSSPKKPKTGILGSKFTHFSFIAKFFQLEKFEGANFKYKDTFLKF